nr:uncharacterized protein C3orf67 homolog [Nerophis lumbriciformis]
MFKHNYQGGAGVEVFSGQGKDPVAKWKLYGGQSSIRKEYDKGVKGFVYCLEGSSKSVKMHLPENGKMSLGLLQRFLAIQVNIPEGKDFSMELVITDVGHLKRRLYLSTVHKELSATLWHAKLPLAGVKRNIWTTLFVDLVSFTGELFKATGFLSLDGITLFANCKVRRIFTVKTEPTVMTSDGMFFNGAGVMDQIPRSCQFPPNVCHECQVLNMSVLRKANLKTTQANTDCGPDQHPAVRSTTSYRSKPQAAPHTASGSRADAAATHASKKGGPAANGMEKGEPSTEKTAYLNPTHQQINVEIEDPEASHLHQEGAPSSLQPHPPEGKVLNKQASERRKLRVQSTAAERLQALLDPANVSHSRRNESREKHSPPSSGLESRQETLTPKETAQVLKTDEFSLNSPDASSPPPTLAEPLPSSTRPASPRDPQVRSCWESNDEEPELQLALQEEVFTFVSPPHSPERGQGRGKQKMEMRDDQVQSPNGTRSEAPPEDDFIGSESDEEKGYSAFPHLTPSGDSNPDLSQCLDLNLELKVAEYQNTEQTSFEDLSPAAGDLHLQSLSSKTAENDGMAPRPCHSSRGNRQDERCGPIEVEEGNQAVDGKNDITLSRSSLREVILDDPLKEEDNTSQPSDSGDWHLDPTSSLQLYMVDDDELQMLASLKREQEEDEHKASGLTASQIHQCNVSMSLSSEDTSTWTHISMPGNQGQHYQKEMNPFQCSNPREWMDVLSPPILPPSSQRRSDNTSNHRQDLIRGGKESENEEMEDEYLNLLYDPCLNCYFDPETGKYYELA